MPAPWRKLDASTAVTLGAELALEVASGHELYGLAVEVTARCDGCDNVLGRSEVGRWFVTHLTWVRPDRPPWPFTTIKHTLPALLAEYDDHLL